MKDLKRRTFIKNTVIAGAGIYMAPAILGRKETANALSVPGIQKNKKVIIAGAGITGLCCAYELMKSGHEVTVLEASGRYGGHVFTGRDGLSDGLYTDFGADHITRPGYERFFEYTKEFELTVLPYPNAEGSEAAPDSNFLKMIDGNFYSREMLADPVVLKKFGFNEREVTFLVRNPWYALKSFFLQRYLSKFTDVNQPFGIGYDDLDKIPITDIYKKEGASKTALRFLGDGGISALYALWRLAVMGSRGIPLSEGETFHLKDGKEQLPIVFAKRLGGLLKLNHPILSIKHDKTGVAVTYK